MFKEDYYAATRLITALLTVAALGLFAAPAFAITSGEAVSGTTQASLSLAAGTGAAFTTGFQPGQTASASGALTATDTSPGWTLQVQDLGTGGGKMVAATGTTCTGSDATLADPLAVTVTSPLAGVTSAGQKSISATNVAVASATAQLLSSSVLTTHYQQIIPASEVMLTGCVYSLTATYTLQ